jgi:hypothetical protein
MSIDGDSFATPERYRQGDVKQHLGTFHVAVFRGHEVDGSEQWSVLTLGMDVAGIRVGTFGYLTNWAHVQHWPDLKIAQPALDLPPVTCRG